MNQVRPSHPLCRRFHQSLLESFSLGVTVCGRLSECYAYRNSDIWSIYWEYDLIYGASEEDCSIYIFVNGKHFDTVPVDSSPYIYTMPRSLKSVSLGLYILPTSPEYVYLYYDLWDQIETRVKLTWNQSGTASSIKVYGNTGPTPERLLKTITDVGISLDSPYGTISGTETHVYGKWSVPEVRFAEVVVTAAETDHVTGCGDTYHDYDSPTYGVLCSYTCSQTGEAGTFYISDRAVEVLHGIYMYSEPGIINVGDEWTIRVSLVNEYTTSPLEDGTYSFKVNTLNGIGQETDLGGALYPVVINVPPRVPTVNSYTYINGSGSITYSITTPSDTTVTKLRIYRNNGWDGTSIADWQPVTETSVSPSSTYTVGPIDDLIEGTNVFVFRCVDSTGKESADVREIIELDGLLHQIHDMPDAPYSFDGELQTNGTILFTLYVGQYTTHVNLYEIDTSTDTYTYIGSSTEHTFTDDYNSVSVVYNPPVDGVITYGARCVNYDTEEQNTDVRTSVIVNRAASSNVTGLSYEVIE